MLNLIITGTLLCGVTVQAILVAIGFPEVKTDDKCMLSGRIPVEFTIYGYALFDAILSSALMSYLLG
jgi:hypothetical protein